MRSQECKTGRFLTSHRRSGGPRDRTGFVLAPSACVHALGAMQQYPHRYWYNNSPRRVAARRCAGANQHSSAARRVSLSLTLLRAVAREREANRGRPRAPSAGTPQRVDRRNVRGRERASAHPASRKGEKSPKTKSPLRPELRRACS